MMERQLRQMVRLIDDLLDVGRISRGNIELRPERLDLSSVALAALETSRPLIQACAHRVTVGTPPEPVFVQGDATRLAQAVSNLLNNAAKYTPRGGQIRLAVARDDGAATVSVADDGVGIPEHMLGQVFDLFVQVDPSLEKVQGGLGIGLTIVRRLVELHGGTVEARSAGPGAGSEFVIRLAAAPPGPSLPATRAPGEAALARTRRILVVDDNRDSALALAMMLHDGHDAHTAHGGVEAVETATIEPHMILSTSCRAQRPRHLPPPPRAAVGEGRGHRGSDELGPGGRAAPVARGRLRRPPRQARGPDRAHRTARVPRVAADDRTIRGRTRRSRVRVGGV
jgi:CheY-like chemotaxis protein